MAKGKSNMTQRVELWLPKSYLSATNSHLRKDKESRKQALERITRSGITRDMKSAGKPIK